jgi:hypothetical protein
MDGAIPVGLAGFEPATPWPPAKCATKLRYSPQNGIVACTRPPQSPYSGVVTAKRRRYAWTMYQRGHAATARTGRRSFFVVATVLALIASACVRNGGTESANACPQVETVGSTAAQINLTLTSRFGNVYPVEDIPLCLTLINQNNQVVYRAGFAVNGQDAQIIDLAIVPASAQQYTLNWAYAFPQDDDQNTCVETIDLSDGIDTRGTMVLSGGCAARVAETQGWVDAQGVLASSSEVEEFSTAGGHCDRDGARFIALGGYFEGAAYVNDPNGYFPRSKLLSSSARLSLGLEPFDEYRGPELEADAYLTFRDAVKLPSDAVSLGYTRGVRQLFTSPSDSGDYLYVVRPDRVERWPVLRPVDACA